MGRLDIPENVSKIPDSKERFELLNKEEERLGVPDGNYPDWHSAETIAIAGCFFTEYPDMGIDFGGYLKLLPSGHCRGMFCDIFGDGLLVGKLSEKEDSLELSKIYFIYTSDRTAQQPLIYELKRKDEVTFIGEWHDSSCPISNGEAICGFYRTKLFLKELFDSVLEARVEAQIDDMIAIDNSSPLDDVSSKDSERYNPETGAFDE